MKCPDKQIIEAASLGLHQEDKALIAHLDNCRACRALLQAYQDYYHIVDSIDDSVIQTTADRLLIPAPQVISLTPLPVSPGSNALRLAAKSKGAGDHTFIRGFVNEQEDIVARLMLENTGKNALLFLIASEEILKTSYLVQIDNITERWLSDASGIVSLGHLNLADIADAKIRLTSPRATFELAPLRDLPKTSIADGTFRVQSRDLDNLAIQIRDSSEKRLYEIRIDTESVESGRQIHVSVQQEQSSQIEKTVNGIAVFEDLDENKTLTISIYQDP